MKLAEALIERADLQKRFDQLEERLQNNALVQEGEKPAEDPEALKELQDYVSSMKIPVPETPPAPPHAAARFDFLDNPAGIRRCEITFGVGNCALTFFTDRGIEQLRAGFGHFEKSILQLTDSRPHPLASYARWTAPETLEILSLLTDSTYRDVWTVNFADAEHLKIKLTDLGFGEIFPAEGTETEEIIHL